MEKRVVFLNCTGVKQRIYEKFRKMYELKKNWGDGEEKPLAYFFLSRFFEMTTLRTRGSLREKGGEIPKHLGRKWAWMGFGWTLNDWSAERKKEPLLFLHLLFCFFGGTNLRRLVCPSLPTPLSPLSSHFYPMEHVNLMQETWGLLKLCSLLFVLKKWIVALDIWAFYSFVWLGLPLSSF